jgi:hypothetical protein
MSVFADDVVAIDAVSEVYADFSECLYAGGAVLVVCDFFVVHAGVAGVAKGKEELVAIFGASLW